MNQIPAVPSSVTKAGLNFNYALWTAGTVLTLATVPWDSDYRNTMSFPTKGGLDSYLNKQANTLKVENMKHMRLDQPIRIDAPFEHVSLYNYVRAHNPAQPVLGGSLPSTYYYFIQSVTYTAPNTTTLNVQLDVWATFFPNVSLGRCYIERGHIGIANENQMYRNGREYLTVPEGLDLGNDMEIVQSDVRTIATSNTGTASEEYYSIMIVTTTDLEKAGSMTGDDPLVVTSSGSTLENLPNSANMYFFDGLDDYRSFLDAYADKAWVTQSIIQVTVIPPLVMTKLNTREAIIQGVSGITITTPDDLGGGIVDQPITMMDNWHKTFDAHLSSRYKNLNKLKTAPYSMFELTSFTGQPVMLRPELLDNEKVEVVVKYHFNPGSGKITFIPRNYNAGVGSNYTMGHVNMTVDAGEWMDMQGTVATLPTFTTVSSGQSAYLASNRNQIEFQHKNASWDQQRAMQGASTAYGQAMSGMKQTGKMNEATVNQTNRGATQNNSTATLQGWRQGAGAVVNGAGQAAGGNPAGGIMNAAAGAGGAWADTMITQQQNTAMAGINNAYANETTAAQLQNQQYLGTTNQNLAEFGAKGDYANAIAGIQARVQDAGALQPTVSGQVGGDTFALATVGWTVTTRMKRIQALAVAEVGEYWLRYGYKINRWVYPPEDLHVCNKFSYWQMQDAAVFASSCPEQYRQTIRGILEKGVTVYKNPDDIGMIDPADNSPLGGISY